MKVLWQDAVGSFLDPSGSDPVLPNGDAGAPSAGGGTAFGPDGMLWVQIGTPLGGGGGPAGSPASDSGLAASSGSSYLIWSDGAGAAQLWNSNESWFRQALAPGAVGVTE